MRAAALQGGVLLGACVLSVWGAPWGLQTPLTHEALRSVALMTFVVGNAGLLWVSTAGLTGAASGTGPARASRANGTALFIGVGSIAVYALAVAWPDGPCVVVEGEVHGRLTFPPRGDRGFGYDPIFIPEGGALTFGEFRLLLACLSVPFTEARAYQWFDMADTDGSGEIEFNLAEGSCQL
jgi:hypothetical protein